MLISKVAKLHLHVNPKAYNYKTIAMGVLPQEVPPWAVSEVVAMICSIKGAKALHYQKCRSGHEAGR